MFRVQLAASPWREKKGMKGMISFSWKRVEQGVQGRWEGEWAGWKEDKEKRSGTFWGKVAGFQSGPNTQKGKKKKKTF